MNPLTLHAARRRTLRLRLFILLGGALMLCAGERAWGVCTNPPPGLVNWWPAENSGADIAGTYPGTLLNGTSYAVGRVGNAFNFDGTNDVVLLSAPALSPPWTAEFWVFRQAAPEDSAVLLSSSNAALKLEQFPNTKRVGITTWGVQDYSYNYTAPIGVWTHLVFVGTAGTTALYTNGVFHGSLSVGISLPRTTMGRDLTNRYSKALKGLLDETSLYNRALTAAEILALYNAGSDGKCVPNNCTNNDNFACRQIISGSNLTNVITNVGATREAGEPLHGGASSSNSIWYSWTAPSSGGVVVQVTGDFDFASPILAVYTGNNLASLTSVAFNFAPFSGSGSPLSKARVVFTAVAGQVYQIAVDGLPTEFFESQGNLTFTLALTPAPTNDLFQNDIVIPGIYYEITNGTFIGASRETSEPTHATSNAQTLWWNWTAPTNLNVVAIPIRLTADAISFPPVFGVYTGISVSSLTPVTTTQIADGMTRTATFSATPNATYRIALAGAQNDTNSVLPIVGNFRFRLNTRALALSIMNVISNVTSTQSVTFTATGRVENLGSAASASLRIRTTAVPGISMRGGNTSSIVGTNIPQNTWLLPALQPGQSTNLPISGIAPAPTDVTAGISSAEGYGVYAELQELVGTTNWTTVDQALVLYGIWPDLEGIPGPGGGVIRLDPGYVGLSTLNPLAAVTTIGPPTVFEGNQAAYYGWARYANNAIVNFTNTSWLTTRFTVTNGLFRPGIVNSNTPVTLTAKYSANGFLYDALTNVTVINLPSPLLSQAKVIGNNFTLRVDGVSNRVHVIEVTTNLSPPQVWQPISTNTLNAIGVWSFTNATGSTPQRFFRAREVE